MATFNKRNWVNGQQPAINDTNLNALESDIQTFGNNILEEANNNVITKFGYDQYSNTSTYNVGDFCIYNNTLYVCTTAIATPEDFSAAKWAVTSIAKLINKAQTQTQLDNISFSTNLGSTAHQATASNPYVVASKTANLKPGKYLIITNGIIASANTTSFQAQIEFLEGSTTHFMYSSAGLGSNDNLYGVMQAVAITTLIGGEKTYSWRISVPPEGSKVVTVKAYQTIWCCAVRIGE